jgi:hypothetical protein
MTQIGDVEKEFWKNTIKGSCFPATGAREDMLYICPPSQGIPHESGEHLSLTDLD